MSRKPSRRQWLVRLFAGMTSLFSLFSLRAASAQQLEATLKEQLEFGLKARRPQEFAWIEMVVNMVDAGELPSKLVTVSFNWSRKQGKYPYQYFVRALRILAARQGIDIPPSG